MEQDMDCFQLAATRNKVRNFCRVCILECNGVDKEMCGCSPVLMPWSILLAVIRSLNLGSLY